MVTDFLADGYDSISGNDEPFNLKAFLLALAKAWAPQPSKERNLVVLGQFNVTLAQIALLCFKVSIHHTAIVLHSKSLWCTTSRAEYKLNQPG